MDNKEIARIKAQGVVNDVTDKARLTVEEIKSDYHKRGLSLSGMYINAIKNSGVSFAKELKDKLMRVYVDTIGSKLDLEFFSNSVSQAVKNFADNFMKSFIEETAIARNSKDVLSIMVQEINRIIAPIKEEMEVALFDRNNQTQKASSVIHPKTKVPDVSFIKRKSLRQIATVNSQEAVSCYEAGLFNAAVVMAGSAMEAILLDMLLRRRKRATGAKHAPKGRKIEEWYLSDLIKVAMDINLLHKSTDKLAEWIKDSRNLVHPGVILRSGRKIEAEEAGITINILSLLCREFQ